MESPQLPAGACKTGPRGSQGVSAETWSHAAYVARSPTQAKPSIHQRSRVASYNHAMNQTPATPWYHENHLHYGGRCSRSALTMKFLNEGVR
jgi:hypothetical protein